VERTFSWLGKCRRLAVDYERKPEHHQAWVQWAMVRVMSSAWPDRHPRSPPTHSLAARRYSHRFLARSRPEGSVYRAKYLTLPFRSRRLMWAISQPFLESGLSVGR
jgi:hypothetical protein